MPTPAVLNRSAISRVIVVHNRRVVQGKSKKPDLHSGEDARRASLRARGASRCGG